MTDLVSVWHACGGAQLIHTSSLYWLV